MGGAIDTILAKSPLALWVCDDASGTLVDSSGNGNDATTSSGIGYRNRLIVPRLGRNTVMITNGYFNPVAWWSGLGSQFTLEAWIARNNLSGNRPIWGTHVSTCPLLRMSGNDGEILWFSTTGGASVTWGGCIGDDHLHHVVFTYDDSSKDSHLVIDKVSKGRRTAPQALAGTSNGIVFGGYNLSQFYNGWAGLVAMYTKILTMKEIIENNKAAGGLLTPYRRRQMRS